MRLSVLPASLALAALLTPMSRAWAQDDPQAGDAKERAAASTASAEADRGGVAHVTLQADEPHQTFLGRGFERLCTAPCSADLPVGHQPLGVVGPDGKMLRGDVAVVDGATIHASRVSHGAWRALGIALMIAGPLGGLAMTIASIKTKEVCVQGSGCFQQEDIDQGLLVGGALLIPATVAPGVLLLVFGRERVHFDVQSGTALAPLPRDVAAWRGAREGASYAPGLTATLRF